MKHPSMRYSRLAAALMLGAAAGLWSLPASAARHRHVANAAGERVQPDRAAQRAVLAGRLGLHAVGCPAGQRGLPGRLEPALLAQAQHLQAEAAAHHRDLREPVRHELRPGRPATGCRGVQRTGLQAGLYLPPADEGRRHQLRQDGFQQVERGALRCVHQRQRLQGLVRLRPELLRQRQHQRRRRRAATRPTTTPISNSGTAPAPPSTCRTSGPRSSTATARAAAPPTWTSAAATACLARPRARDDAPHRQPVPLHALRAGDAATPILGACHHGCCRRRRRYPEAPAVHEFFRQSGSSTITVGLALSPHRRRHDGEDHSAHGHGHRHDWAGLHQRPAPAPGRQHLYRHARRRQATRSRTATARPASSWRTRPST